MKYKLILLVFALIWSSCLLKNKVVKSESAGIPRSDSLFISVKAINLTEDVSSLSSRNDELIFLIYKYSSDSTAIPSLLLSEFFVLDSAHSQQDFTAVYREFSANEKLCFVLIEMDTEKNKEQIEPVVRVNLNAIISDQQTGKKQLTEKLLGDDDLIGLSVISANEIRKGEKQTLNYSGNHLFDFYKYEIGYWR